MFEFLILFVLHLITLFADGTELLTPSQEIKDETQIAGAPAELRVHASHDTVELFWLPPRDENVMIRGYQIGWGVNIPDIEKATVDPKLRHYTIRGLKPNREYVISLRAFNNIGQGFPIYETVKTYSYGKIPMDTSNKEYDDKLLTPVGLLAETVSSSQIHLSWIDPNEETFNQLYTIKYGISGVMNDEAKEINTTENEYLFEGLRPDSQYEFTVKLADSSQWSMAAMNRTFPAPPSSPPRDLTVIGPQSERDDPSAVTLNWQPPKYANGEIKEYILFYTANLESHERDWTMASVEGDRLSKFIRALNPETTYHFKLQARNVKGYGPLSSTISYTTPPNNRDTGHGLQKHFEIDQQNSTLLQHTLELFSANLTNVLLGFVTVILLVLLISIVIVCSQQKKSATSSRKNSSRSKHGHAYAQGRKLSGNCTVDDDLWIQQHHGGRFAALVNNSANNASIGGIVYEDFDLSATGNNGSQRILLVDHQQRAFIASNGAQAPIMGSPIPQYQSHYASAPQHAHGNAFSKNDSLTNSYTSDYHGLSSPSPRAQRIYRQRKRNSLPPRISLSTSQSPMVTKPMRRTMMEQTGNGHIYGRHQQRGSRQSDSPASYATFWPAAVPDVGQKHSTPLATARSKSTIDVNSDNDNQPPTHGERQSHGLDECTCQQNSGVEKMMGVKQAKRTATSNYGVSSKSPMKAVNFAHNLVTVAKLDEEKITFIDDNEIDEVATEETNECTLSRNIHHPAISNGQFMHQNILAQKGHQTPATPRNPHIVYARTDRQPITKVDFGLDTPLPFDEENVIADGMKVPERANNGYQSVIHVHNPAASMHSFVSKESADEQQHSQQQQQKVAHIVRPIISGSTPTSTTRNEANDLPSYQQQKTPPVIGKRCSATNAKVPIGRAMAQPRVNIANTPDTSSTSPYSSVRVQHQQHDFTNGQFASSEHRAAQMDSNLQFMKQKNDPTPTEELNVHEIDQMIDTLQQLQHEFNDGEA